MENEKKGPLTIATPSPFSTEIRTSSLPRVFRHNPDLLFNGEAGPAEYLIQFNTELEVYQVPEPTRCRLFTASLRGSAQQWFSKLGPATISTWQQLEDLFVRQCQSTLHYAPLVAILANIKPKEAERSYRSGCKKFPYCWDEREVYVLEEPASELRMLAEFYEHAEPFKRVEKFM